MTGWTAAKIRQLGPTCDVPTAFHIVSGGRSRDAAYRAIRAGTFPLPVLRVGGRMRVPTAAVLALLGLGDGAPQNRSPSAELDGSEPGAPAVQHPAASRGAHPHNETGGSVTEPPASIVATLGRRTTDGQRTATRGH